jgi:hypothetical protein
VGSSTRTRSSGRAARRSANRHRGTPPRASRRPGRRGQQRHPYRPQIVRIVHGDPAERDRGAGRLRPTRGGSVEKGAQVAGRPRCGRPATT